MVYIREHCSICCDFLAQLQYMKTHVHEHILQMGKKYDVLAKTPIVRTKTEFNNYFIATVYRHTQYLSIPSVPSVKC